MSRIILNSPATVQFRLTPGVWELRQATNGRRYFQFKRNHNALAPLMDAWKARERFVTIPEDWDAALAFLRDTGEFKSSGHGHFPADLPAFVKWQRLIRDLMAQPAHRWREVLSAYSEHQRLVVPRL